MIKTINQKSWIDDLKAGDAFLGHDTSSSRDVRISPSNIDTYITSLAHYYTTNSTVLN